MRTIRASLLTRVSSAAAVAVLATGGVMATATAASAAKGHHHPKLASTTLSIKNKAIAHAKHHADAITGVLRSHHKGVAAETITLDSRTGKKPRWAAVGTGTTGSDGSVTFTVARPPGPSTKWSSPATRRTGRATATSSRSRLSRSRRPARPAHRREAIVAGALFGMRAPCHFLGGARLA